MSMFLWEWRTLYLQITREIAVPNFWNRRNVLAFPWSKLNLTFQFPFLDNYSIDNFKFNLKKFLILVFLIENIVCFHTNYSILLKSTFYYFALIKMKSLRLFKNNYLKKQIISLTRTRCFQIIWPNW